MYTYGTRYCTNTHSATFAHTLLLGLFSDHLHTDMYMGLCLDGHDMTGPGSRHMQSVT